MDHEVTSLGYGEEAHLSTLRSAGGETRNTDAPGEAIHSIQRLLDGFDGEHSLKKLFWTQLSYDRVRDPLSPEFLHPETKKAMHTLEVFASSEARIIVYAALNKLLDGTQLEQMVWAIERKMPNCVVLLYDSKRWSLVYPDEAVKPHVRILALPGPICERHKTATQLAALDAVQGGSGGEVHTFESAEKLDVFFPGVMPHLDDLLNDFARYASHRDPEIRDLLPFIREIGQYPLLTAEQERGEDLTGNERPPDGSALTYQQWRLTTHNLRLVFWMARKCPRVEMTLSDNVQEGCIGLLTAAKRFEPERGNRFTTYAFHWIRQAMYRGMYNQCNLIRWPVYQGQRLMAARLKGEEVGLSAGEKPVRFMPWNFTRMSLYGSDLVDTRSKQELEEAIEIAVCSLEPRAQEVMRLRFGLGGGDEQTLQAIGDQFGFTREYIRQIEAKSLRFLSHRFRHMLGVQVDAFVWRRSRALNDGAACSFAPFQDYIQGQYSTTYERE